MMTKELVVATRFVELILGNKGDTTPDAVYDLFEIHQGNKKVLLEHLKAINSITGKAIKELEKEMKNEKVI